MFNSNYSPSLLHSTSLGAPCSITSLTSRLSGDGLAENNRCGNEGPTHHVRRSINGLSGILSHKARESLSNNTNTNNMRPVVLAERQPLAQIFEAPAWAVPAKGEARLEVSSLLTDARVNNRTLSPQEDTFLTVVLSLFLLVPSAGMRNHWKTITSRPHIQVPCAHRTISTL